jgi:hypothetical protein
MVTGLNASLLNYLSTQGLDNSAANGKATANARAKNNSVTSQASRAALQRAAGTAKSSAANHQLDTAQKKLGSELRAAMAKVGVHLSGAIDISVKSDGSVSVGGSDEDKAAVKAFLKADTSQPSFANRIAEQAKEAMKLSTTIQQSAAISQAAKLAKTAGGVMSLYTSLMHQTSSTSVVFSVSPTSSSLSYPGALATNA